MPHNPLRITLLVPELLWPEPEDREAWDGLVCPALATLLARGRPGGAVLSARLRPP